MEAPTPASAGYYFHATNFLQSMSVNKPSKLRLSIERLSTFLSRHRNVSLRLKGCCRCETRPLRREEASALLREAIELSYHNLERD